MPIWTLSLLWQTWESALSSFCPLASPPQFPGIGCWGTRRERGKRAVSEGPEDRTVAELPQERLESDG